MNHGISYLYANGRVAVLEKSLIGRDKLLSLAESESFELALSSVREWGFGRDADENSGITGLTLAEESSAIGFFRSMMVNDSVVKAFLLHYDCLNAKIAMKCKYMRIPFEITTADGNVSSKEIYERVIKDDYSCFPENMAKALNEADYHFSEGRRSPSIIDRLLDKALYADIDAFKKKCQSKGIKDFFTRGADCTNILTYVRAKVAGIDPEEFFVIGGNIDKDRLFKAMENPVEGALLFKGGVYETVYNAAKAFSEGKISVHLMQAEAEKVKRAALMPYKGNDGIEPVVLYFMSKKTEIANVRLALVCKKNGLDAQTLSERVKELYV